MAKMGKARLEVNTVTPATKEMKKLLFALDTMTEEKAVAGFTNIIKSSCKEDKALLHLQLFFHLPYPEELEAVQEDPGDFVFLVPGYCSESRLSPKLYCDIVVDGELLTHFLQLAHHLQNKPFIQELVRNVVAKFLSTENHHDLFPNVIFMLGKISRREVATEVFFLNQFTHLLSEFLNHGLMLKYEKLCCLFRLAGVVCMKAEDYAAGGSDLLELLEEWNFDLTNRIAKETKTYLSDFFQDDFTDQQHGIRIEVLSAIENAISQLQVSPEEEEEWKGIRKTHRIYWSEFIGVHAFLAKSILEKYSSSSSAKEGELDPSKISNLMDALTKWSQHRPKLTRTDFHGDIAHFDQFYKILKRFGEKERDRAQLLPKFMEFSYKDVYCSKDGLRIAEKYLLPGGDFATVSSYILTSLKRDQMPDECRGGGGVPPPVKFMIQKLLCSNPEMKVRRDEIISEIFKDGSHSDLILSDFSYHVNNLCSKIGTIEKEEKDIAQIDHNRDLVFSTCLEDPAHAIMSLMHHSIASGNFKALTFAKPFLMISSSAKNSSPIANYCFKKLLDNAVEHDPILGCVADASSALILNQILSARELLDIYTKKIFNGLNSETPNVKKVSKLYQILHSFANALIDLNRNGDYTLLLQEILKFTYNSKKLTYCIDPETFGRDLLFIRCLCSATLAALVRAPGVDPDHTMMKKLSEKVFLQNINNILLAQTHVLQLGNLYVRVPHLREIIHSSLTHTNDEQEKLLESMLSDVSSLQDTLFIMANGSDVEEWPLILEFFIQIVEKSPDRNYDLGHLITRSLPLAWNNCIAVSAQPELRQYLKFYHKAVQSLLKTGLASTPTKRQAIYSVVDLAKDMYASLKRRKAHGDKNALQITLQQVMLLLLEVLNSVISHDPEEFGKELQDKVLRSFASLPIMQRGGCEPIRKCIFDRAINFQEDSSKITLSDCATSIENKSVASVANLRDIFHKGTVNIAIID